MKEKQPNINIPEPAHPTARKERLPGDQPKPALEDPFCDERLQSILNSSSYRPAIEDPGFLESEEVRAVRLQLDYLKPEILMRKHGIRNTIVVFGSTRIVEPQAAQRKVFQLRKALRMQPGDEAIQARLTVAESILDKSHYYDTAREFARLVAAAGQGPGDSGLVVKTGGGESSPLQPRCVLRNPVF